MLFWLYYIVGGWLDTHYEYVCVRGKVSVFALTTYFDDGDIALEQTHTHTPLHCRLLDIAAEINVADYCWHQEQQHYMTHSHGEAPPMASPSIWVNGVTDWFYLFFHNISHSLYPSLSLQHMCTDTHTRTHTPPTHTHTLKQRYVVAPDSTKLKSSGSSSFL